MYSSTLPSLSALDCGWVVDATPRPLYPSGKTRYPFYRRLGGPQSLSGRVRKISSPTGVRSPDRPARSESIYLSWVYSYAKLWLLVSSVLSNCFIYVRVYSTVISCNFCLLNYFLILSFALWCYSLWMFFTLSCFNFRFRTIGITPAGTFWLWNNGGRFL